MGRGALRIRQCLRIIAPLNPRGRHLGGLNARFEQALYGSDRCAGVGMSARTPVSQADRGWLHKRLYVCTVCACPQEKFMRNLEFRYVYTPSRFRAPRWVSRILAWL